MTYVYGWSVNYTDYRESCRRERTESLIGPMVAILKMYTNKVRYLLKKKSREAPVRFHARKVGLRAGR